MPVTPVPRRNASAFTASVVMVLISFALFFIPLLNGLFAGLVGGYMAGGVRRALVAAVLPAIVVGVGLAILLLVFKAPVLAAIVGTVGGLAVLLSDVGLFLGAAIGGAMAHGRTRRELSA